MDKQRLPTLPLKSWGSSLSLAAATDMASLGVPGDSVAQDCGQHKQQQGRELVSLEPLEKSQMLANCHKCRDNTYRSLLQNAIRPYRQAVGSAVFPVAQAGVQLVSDPGLRFAEECAPAGTTAARAAASLLRAQHLLRHLQLPELADLEQAREALRVDHVGQHLEVHQRLPAVLEADLQPGGAGALAPRLLAGSVEPVDLPNLRADMGEETTKISKY